MGLSRRGLMRAGVLGVLSGPCLGAISSTRTEAGIAYDGPGIYLYPGWGAPRPYLVRPADGSGQGLEFLDPATETVLWTQSLCLCGDFAGKLS